MDLQVGKYIFNTRFCLGEGAYGKVFMGKSQNGEPVAIKQIDVKFIEQQDKYIKQQILNEIEILKKCDHPNIVRFIDLIDTPKYIYIIIEYCKDGDLKELLNAKRLPETEGIFYPFNIVSQIVEGFKELRKHGIIHRDLKPANILIDNGVYKIADFGFAKIVNNYSSSHMLKSLVGSPYYMAPQLLGYQQYCYKCDIWSLAVIYYEMLTGDLPWLASDPQSLLKKIIQQPIKYSDMKVSAFSQAFLQQTLTIDEYRRPTWDEVATMIQSSPFQSQSPLKKRYIFEDATDNVSNPIWTNTSQSQTRSQIGSVQIDPELQNLRNELIFKHYLCQEIFVNKDEIIQFCDENNILLRLAFILSKCVVYQSQQLVRLCKEPTFSRTIQKENEFYIKFHQDIEAFITLDISLEKANSFCLQFCLQYLRVAQQKMPFNQQYLLVITEFLINFVRVLRDGGETIDFEELAHSKINDYDFQLYVQILSTNLSAIII